MNEETLSPEVVDIPPGQSVMYWPELGDLDDSGERIAPSPKVALQRAKDFMDRLNNVGAKITAAIPVSVETGDLDGFGTNVVTKTLIILQKD